MDIIVPPEDHTIGPGRPPKVAKLIEQYGLTSIGEEMERAWTDERETRRSLRELAESFNKQLVANAMAEAGMNTINGEPENVHRLLTDDDVSSADRTRARRRLDREGIDADELLDNFVSYQAIGTYLTECRNAEYSRDERDQKSAEATNIQRLRGRTAAATEAKIEQLSRSGRLDIGEFQTIVDVSVVCEDCGSQYEVSELPDRGVCSCSTGI